jgi:hypothetical protein
VYTDAEGKLLCIGCSLGGPRWWDGLLNVKGENMKETTDSRVVVEASHDSGHSADPWRAPKLTVLGSAADLTASGGAILPDGPGST